MSTKHIVKSYDEDLKYLQDKLNRMGMLAVAQIDQALQAMIKRDTAMAQAVIEKDPEIDQLEHAVDTFAVRMIALRQPVAQDLRSVVAALKISSHLERIADYGMNIARRAITLTDMPRPKTFSTLKRMVEMTQEMIRDVLQAYGSMNSEKAMEVWYRDREVDDLYTSYLRELLTYMMEDPRNIGPCTQLLFAAKNVERIGDHVTNIAELIHYQIYGTLFKEPTAQNPLSS